MWFRSLPTTPRGLREAEDEAGCLTENFGFEATLASRTYTSVLSVDYHSNSAAMVIHSHTPPLTYTWNVILFAKYGIVMFSCTVGLLFVIVWISSWWRYVLSETMFVCVDRIHQEGHGWPVGEISRWIHPPFPPITLIALDNLREQNQSTVPHVFFKATPLPITWRTS